MEPLGVKPDFLAKLGTPTIAVLPSLLLCDFGHLADEIARLETAGVRGFHLDVMDGHFVPNFTYGLPIVEAARRATELPLDVHLMIDNPGEYLEQFRAAGSDQITIHVEAVADPRPLLDEIRALGASAGLALNPPTPLQNIEPALPHCDTVLVMSVMPGFGGQKFAPIALEKLAALHKRADWKVCWRSTAALITKRSPTVRRRARIYSSSVRQSLRRTIIRCEFES
jgi:ribulose-phosphate 3-epimerase